MEQSGKRDDRNFGPSYWRRAARDGVVLNVSDDPKVPWLGAFFDAFDSAFAIPEEKETLAGFRDCLALNFGAEASRLTRELVPFREIVLLARTQDGEALGGANLLALDLGETLTVNLNYAFVMRSYRARGWLREILVAINDKARTIFDRPPDFPVLVFIEQNDPTRLSAVKRALDLRTSGLDAEVRLRIWARLGAKLLDFDYRQPPLSRDHAADDGLVLGVLGAQEASISACLLRDHLRAFFVISVLKGAPLTSEEVARTQVEGLSRACDAHRHVSLHDQARAVDGLADARGRTLLEIARQMTT